MAIGTGTAILGSAALGAAGSMMGGGGGETVTQPVRTSIENYSPEAREFLEGTVAQDVYGLYGRPRIETPSQRYIDPQDFTSNQVLGQLQQRADYMRRNAQMQPQQMQPQQMQPSENIDIMRAIGRLALEQQIADKKRGGGFNYMSENSMRNNVSEDYLTALGRQQTMQPATQRPGRIGQSYSDDQIRQMYAGLPVENMPTLEMVGYNTPYVQQLLAASDANVQNTFPTQMY